MFHFAWPIFLLLIPFLWFIPTFLPKLHKHNDWMLCVPFLSRITALDQQLSAHLHGSFSFKKYLSIVAWCLLLLAAANPQWLSNPLPISQDGRNIMLAIDISPSMQIPDLQQNNQTINRLQSVKQVAHNFIEKRYGDKIGLILFGSKAYLQTPLTLDHQTVRHMLNDATIGLAGDSTAIGDAVALAVKKFQTENIKSRVLILLTDGANNSGTIDPMEAAELAKDNLIKIYTIGIGATELRVNGIFGHQLINPAADLDESLLKKISDTTQGKYFRARDEKSLFNILEAINQLEPVYVDSKTVRTITPLFYWPLGLALLCFIGLIFPNLKMRRQE